MAPSGPVKPDRPFRPKKKLGQNFLMDPNIIGNIISRSGYVKDDVVLEIGPGMGALTIPLSRQVKAIVAVEKDSRLIKELEDRFLSEGIDNVELINRDILRVDLDEIRGMSSGPLKVIGNLPYNISSPVIWKLIRNRKSIESAVLMFQAEVAERLSAAPGGKIYGALSILVQYHVNVEVLCNVPATAFSPRPKVASKVVRLDFNRPYPVRALDDEIFRRLVKGAFSQRRKTMVNSLSAVFPSLGKAGLLEAVERCGIDPGARAETIDIERFLRLCSVILPEIAKSGR